MNNNIDPSILSAYDYESQFMQSQQKGNRRVKMERGKMWVIRFLPAKLGPQKTWFARIARHWLSMKPVVCPRYTSPDFGGDPDAYCPCCEVAAIVNESPDPEISKFGYSAQGNPQWLTYCIAFEKDGSEQALREILNPYEFTHYKSTFEELMAFYKAGLRRSPESIFDYKLGNDFVVTKTGKGLKLDKQDSAPIFDPKDPNYKSYIEKIESAIKMPKIQMPTAEQLEAFSLKIQEFADKLADGHGAAPAEGGRGRRRPAPQEDIDDPSGTEGGYHENDEPAPARPRAAAAATPARRSAPAPAPAEEELAQDDSNPELAPVAPAAPAARRVAPAATPAARRPAPVEAPVPTESEAPAPAPARRAAAAPSQTLTPSPNRQRAAAAASEAAGAPEEPGEEEELPPEETDPAPPVEAALNESEEPAEPPAVARKGGAGLGSSIRNKIDGLSRRGA